MASYLPSCVNQHSRMHHTDTKRDIHWSGFDFRLSYFRDDNDDDYDNDDDDDRTGVITWDSLCGA